MNKHQPCVVTYLNPRRGLLTGACRASLTRSRSETRALPCIVAANAPDIREQLSRYCLRSVYYARHRHLFFVWGLFRDRINSTSILGNGGRFCSNPSWHNIIYIAWQVRRALPGAGAGRSACRLAEQQWPHVNDGGTKVDEHEWYDGGSNLFRSFSYTVDSTWSRRSRRSDDFGRAANLRNRDRRGGDYRALGQLLRRVFKIQPVRHCHAIQCMICIAPRDPSIVYPARSIPVLYLLAAREASTRPRIAFRCFSCVFCAGVSSNIARRIVIV